MSAAVTSVVCYMAVLMLPFRELDNSFYSAFPRFMVIVMVSFLTYGVVSKALKLHEIDPVIARVRRVLSRLDGRT